MKSAQIYGLLRQKQAKAAEKLQQTAPRGSREEGSPPHPPRQPDRPHPVAATRHTSATRRAQVCRPTGRTCARRRTHLCPRSSGQARPRPLSPAPCGRKGTDVAVGLVHQPVAPGIDAQEDEQQDGEPPQRRTAVTEERQRDAYDRHQAQHHADVDQKMKEQDAQHRVTVDTPEGRRLPFGQMQQPQDERQETAAARRTNQGSPLPRPRCRR